MHITILIHVLVVLLGCSVYQTAGQTQHQTVTVGQRLENEIASCDEYSYYKVEVSSPCEDLRIQVEAIEGEPNLYVSKDPNKYPTYTSLSWSSYEWGSEDLTISSWDPEFNIGTYYIGVHAYCGDDVDTGYTNARYSLSVANVPSSHPHSEIVPSGSVDGILAVNGYRYYRFCLTSSCSNVEVRLTNCIDPSTCPTSYAWPELLVSRSIEEPVISDHAWKLASVDKRTIDLTPSDPDFYPGHYFVGVYGWCTPIEHCPDTAVCGPCTYAQDHPYTVSLTVTPTLDGCVEKSPLELCEGGAASTLSYSPVFLLLTVLLSVCTQCASLF